MKNILLSFIITNLFFLTACDNNNFPKYVELTELRILEIAADLPEVDPGTLVTLTPYISDVNNSGALSFAWQACVDAGISYGADATCDGNPTATGINTGAVAGLNAGNTYTGPVGTFSVTVPAAILTLASPMTLYNGIAYLVTYNVTDTSGNTVKAIKRILVTDPSKTTKNTNPTITQVLADGVALGNLSAGAKVELSMSSNAGESYNVKNSDGSLTPHLETLQTTWFYSDGESKYYRTLGADKNLFTAPESYPGSRSSFIVAVLRDGRGGITVQKTVIHP